MAKSKPRQRRKVPKVNPLLDSQVASAIQGQVKPIQGQLANVNKQYGANANSANLGQAGLQSELGGLGTQLQSANANALALAGQHAVGSQEQVKNSVDFLKSVLGGYTGDQGAGLQSAADLANAQANASGVEGAAAQGFANRASGADLAAMRGSSALANQEYLRQNQVGRTADQRVLQNQISAIRGNAPAIRRGFLSENLDNAIKRQQLNMQKQQLGLEKRKQQYDIRADQRNAAENARQFDANLSAKEAEAVAGGEGDKAKEIAKQNDKWQKVASKVYDEYNKAPAGAGFNDPKALYRRLWARMTDVGMPPSTAAQYAFKWAWAGGTGQSFKGTDLLAPKRALDLLKSEGVGKLVSQYIINTAFGPDGWQRATAAAGTSPAVGPGAGGTVQG